MKLIETVWPWSGSKHLIAIAWLAVMAIAVLAYFPGLAGPFLFDDFGSITPLGSHGGVTDWHSFKAFVFGGFAGPTGRPISLLTFLIDANNWPADAWPFKRTNLVIHLLNGLVLGVLVRSILRILDFDENEVRWIALVSSALWILHPFLVSTTLYVVQRMAQLSTLFMFTGLAFYLYGRSFLAENPKKAYTRMSLAIGGFTLLAMLSKENGILLPLLVGVIEITVVASQRHRLPGLNRLWAAAFIVLPAVVVGLYLGDRFFHDDFFEIVAPRDFSVYERLLTQGRVLVEYMQHWFLPKLYTTGVFQDHYIKSSGLLEPISTALSIVFHVFLITVAFVKRRQWPLFALSILFFYGCHLLESTVVNLELYFEHRNYNATAFLLLPLVVLVRRITSTRAFAGTTILVLILLGSFTRYSATVWQSLPSMIESSALKAPTSARAQAQYSKLLFVAGQEDKALAVIDRAMQNIPGDKPLLITSRLYFLCNRNMLDIHAFSSAADKLANMLFDSRSLKAYNVFAQEVATGRCPNIELEQLEFMFSRMLDVPANGDPTSIEYSHINFLIGYTRVYSGRPVAALEAFQRSLAARPGASHSMAMAAQLASNGYNREALILADGALERLREEMADNSKLASNVKESDIKAFQEIVRADLAAQQDGDISGQGE